MALCCCSTLAPDQHQTCCKALLRYRFGRWVSTGSSAGAHVPLSPTSCTGHALTYFCCTKGVPEAGGTHRGAEGEGTCGQRGEWRQDMVIMLHPNSHPRAQWSKFGPPLAA